MHTVKHFLIACAIMLVGSQSFAISAAKEQAIAERLKPVGTVCVQGDECAAAVVAEDVALSPEDIYNKNCMGCHATGAAGAPKMGDVAAWTARLAKGKDTLYSNAINGVNSMPAKGLCMSCSDDDIKATVDFILGKSQ